jgi:beta-lactamase class A
MTTLRGLLAAFLVLGAGLAEARTPRVGPGRSLAAIERASGGRLGVALVNANGQVLLSHRRDERFAMCSTFKLLLAGFVLDNQVGSLRTPLLYGRADILPNSPVSEDRLSSSGRGQLNVNSASMAIVVRSDNTAANLLLRHIGGPERLNAWLRGRGDRVTRLDRYETALNENRRGDPRDTTSPLAMARSSHLLLIGDTLRASHRRWLREWTAESSTGLRRIRAGLPAGWAAGDKTGTCGNAVNDVAFFRTPAGNEYILAVYLDRPTDVARGEAVIADVARVAAGLVR